MVFSSTLFLFGFLPLFLTAYYACPVRGRNYVQSWFDGSFQKNAEDRFVRELGFRAQLVRTNNELNFVLFGDVVPHLMVGPNDQLFETAYHPRQDWFEGHIIELRERIDRLARLRIGLAARGVALVVLISPSKARTYPEELPTPLRRIAAMKVPTRYDVIRPLLALRDIPVIDAVEQFGLWKGTLPVRLFAKGGTHWNYHAAALVAESLVNRLAEDSGAQYPGLEVLGHDLSWPIRMADRDIADLTNLWNPERFMDRVPYPVFEEMNPQVENQRSLLFVGSSFVWQIADILGDRGICSKLDVYYYHKVRYQYSVWPQRAAAVRGPSVEELQLGAEITKYDAVILEINETIMDHLGFGFIEEACEALGLEIAARPGR